MNWTGEVAGRGARVFRPPLLRRMEEAWQRASGPVGRWVQVVRPDGSPIGELEFVRLDEASDAGLDRVRDACRRLAGEVGPSGFLARVLTPAWTAADGYVNAWEKALELGPAGLALHGTIEVRDQAGSVVGLQRRVAARAAARGVRPEHGVWWVWPAVLGTGVYGGYFGAAQGVLLLAILGIGIDDDLQRLNGTKNALAFVANGIAAVVFIAVAHVDWRVAALIALGSVVGGQVGSIIGKRLPPLVFRTIIVVVGVVAIVSLLT